MAKLAGVTAKLQRARAHISELELALDPIIEAAVQTIWLEPNADRTELVVRVGKLPKIGDHVSTIVGDALFNMRSALDHLAHCLVELDNGSPNDETQFPIHPTALNKKGNPRQPPDIQPGIGRADILDALQNVQPYMRKPVHPCHDDLAAIQFLNNRDKHRLLLTVMQHVDVTASLWAVPPGVSVTDYEFFHGPIDDDAPIAKFAFAPAAPEDFDPNIGLEVFINETAPDAVPGNRLFRHFPVAEMLGFWLDGVVARIDHHFTPLFPGEPRLRSLVPYGPDAGRHWRPVKRGPNDTVLGAGIYIPPGSLDHFHGKAT